MGAIRLAAMSLRDHPEPARFIADFAGDDRAISDYLLSEVMSAVSDEDRDFLLARRWRACSTASSRMRSRARATVTAGSPNSPAAARCSHRSTGAASGIAITRCSPSCCGPSCAASGRTRCAELHRRAASWLADHGDDGRGLLHAVEAGAWDLAARLAGERWIDLLIQGEIARAAPARRPHPGRPRGGRPRAGAGAGERAGRARRRGQARGGAAPRRARARARARPSACPRFDVSLAAIRLYLARLRGDLDAALAAGRDWRAAVGSSPAWWRATCARSR